MTQGKFTPVVNEKGALITVIRPDAVGEFLDAVNDQAAEQEEQPRKGLILSVYRSADIGDCTNGGVSAKAARLTVTGVRYDYGSDYASGKRVPKDPKRAEPLPREAQVFEASDRAPEVVLVVRDNGIYRWLSLEPAERVPETSAGWMAGGNYAGSCDSRWSGLTGDGRPVAIHDRSETWEQYNRLTV